MSRASSMISLAMKFLKGYNTSTFKRYTNKVIGTTIIPYMYIGENDY